MVARRGGTTWWRRRAQRWSAGVGEARSGGSAKQVAVEQAVSGGMVGSLVARR